MATLPHRSLATPLALAWAVLVVYASLYPLADWRWPPGHDLGALLLLPRTRWQGGFEAWSNGLGYLPLGALVCIGVRRSGGSLRAALLAGMLVPAALSYMMEVLQQFLPRRVPALEDFALNSGGGVAGALLALATHGLGLVERWQRLRARWVTRDSAGGLTLVALWPLGLLFPAPVPLGLGQVGERLREWALALLDDVPWATGLHGLLAAPAAPGAPLRPLTETLIVSCGMLAPVFVAYGVMPRGWRRLVAAAGAVLLAVGSMTMSTLLNFGPAHALAWVTEPAREGIVIALLVALPAALAGPRVVLGLGLVALTALVVGVAQAPSDPYFAQSLQAWEQGRFVRFHGLSQWVGWLWPYAAMAWVFTRLAAPARP